jgi:hypothetical protein
VPHEPRPHAARHAPISSTGTPLYLPGSMGGSAGRAPGGAVTRRSPPRSPPRGQRGADRRPPPEPERAGRALP